MPISIYLTLVCASYHKRNSLIEIEFVFVCAVHCGKPVILQQEVGKHHGTFFIWRLWTAALSGTAPEALGVPNRPPEQLLYLNPAVAMVEIVADTEITTSDMGKIMAEIRGTGGIQCNGDICFTINGGGVVPVDVKPGGNADCPPNMRCADQPAIGTVFDPKPIETGHFWPRFAVTFAGLSLLLTLASMRLVVPAGLGFRLRRRRPLSPSEAEG